jgi:hypothetical protein
MYFVSKVVEFPGEVVDVDTLPTAVRLPPIGEKAYPHEIPPVPKPGLSVVGTDHQLKEPYGGKRE